MTFLATEVYVALRKKIEEQGHGDDLAWANSIPPCRDADSFLGIFIWVLCHSGMRYKTGVAIHGRIMNAIEEGRAIGDVFGHKRKVQAILDVQKRKDELFDEWMKLRTPQEKVEWCERLPWIGKITRYHLARDLGEMGFCKPDRHLERIASTSGESPQKMCERLADASGDTVACVDAVLWWAAVLKLPME